MITRRNVRTRLLVVMMAVAFLLFSSPARIDAAASSTWTNPIFLTPSSDLYLGTQLDLGQNYIYVMSWLYDSGPIYLYRSDDGGTSWITTDTLGVGVFRGEPGMCVYKDGANDNILLSTAGSVFKSTDSGSSFQYLSDLPLPLDSNWWRQMGIGNNATWLQRPADSSIYVVGSRAIGLPWEGGHYVVSFTKSSDNGSSWTEPAIIGNPTRNSSFPNIVGNGESLYIVYYSETAEGSNLCVRKSSDWGNTWSTESVLLPSSAHGWLVAHSLQNLGSRNALLTFDDWATATPNNPQSGQYYGSYGYLDYSSLTYQEIGNVSGPDWSLEVALNGGFAGKLASDDTFHVSWLKAVTPWNYSATWVMYRSSSNTGLAFNSPAIEGMPSTEASIWNRYEFTAHSRSSDNGTNEWALRTNASWLSVSSSDENHCTVAGEPAISGSYWVNLTVSDLDSSDFLNWSIIVVKGPIPIIATASAYYVLEDQLFTVGLSSDQSVAWSLVTNASWLSMSSTGHLSGIPSNADSGSTYYVSIRASNENGTVYQNWTLCVVNQEPIFSTIPSTLGVVGSEYTYVASADDIGIGGGEFVGVMSNLNQSYSFDRATGILRFTPAWPGTAWFNLSADDGRGASNSKTSLNWTVTIISDRYVGSEEQLNSAWNIINLTLLQVDALMDELNTTLAMLNSTQNQLDSVQDQLEDERDNLSTAQIDTNGLESQILVLDIVVGLMAVAIAALLIAYFRRRPES